MKMLAPDIFPGSPVRFRLDGVVCPQRDLLYERTTGQLELAGRVIFLSDEGESPNRFAIVEVRGIASPVVVMIEEIQKYREDSREQASEITNY